MPDITTRDAKLIQYLNEAYGKEKQLETALEAHIAMTTRTPYKRRLQAHLRETKGHARAVERRIKELGGSAESVSVPGPEVISEAATRVQEVAQRGAALAQGPLHAVRGTGEQEKLLKNAKSEYTDEAEEIANYTAIETLAQSVGDKKTAGVARGIRRQEERMASFLERLIPQLTKAVAQAEIPASERNGGSRRRASSRSGSARRTSRSGGARRTSSRARTSARSTSRGTSRKSQRSSGGAASGRRKATGRRTGSRAAAGTARRRPTSTRRAASGRAKRSSPRASARRAGARS